MPLIEFISMDNFIPRKTRESLLRAASNPRPAGPPPTHTMSYISGTGDDFEDNFLRAGSISRLHDWHMYGRTLEMNRGRIATACVLFLRFASLMIKYQMQT